MSLLSCNIKEDTFSRLECYTSRNYGVLVPKEMFTNLRKKIYCYGKETREVIARTKDPTQKKGRKSNNCRKTKEGIKYVE